MKRIIVLFCLFFSVLFSKAEKSNQDYLLELDHVLTHQQTYTKQKEDTLDHLKEELHNSNTDKNAFEYATELFKVYQTYNLDSALVYSKMSLELSEKQEDKEQHIYAQINLGVLYCYLGMYKEASVIFEQLDAQAYSEWLKSQYHHFGLTVYRCLYEYSTDEEFSAFYYIQMNEHRDSILHYQPDDYTLKAEALQHKGNYNAALQTLQQVISEKEETRVAAFQFYVLSEIYAQQGNYEMQKRYLTLSAIVDIKNAVKEYISLRKLALLLYQEGDLERAYRYIHQCVADAKECNARFRSLEVAQILPLIDSSYKEKENLQKEKMQQILILVSILTILLLINLVYVYIQIKKLNTARKEQKEINEQLEQANGEQSILNQELKQLNEEIRASYIEQRLLNDKLTEANKVKEEYIMRFMNLCSEYLSKMESYRKELNRIAATRKTEDLYKAIKSTRFIQDEIDEFYYRFDDAFLTLFPDFVNRINSLLLPNEQITLKEGERLNTELRIYALLKLGISDSTYIADFLRCSLSTIYNYRTKMRNKAIDRNSFEAKVISVT